MKEKIKSHGLQIGKRIIEKKVGYIRYKSTRTAEEHQRYKEVRNKMNVKIQNLKKPYWEKFSIDMQYDLYEGQKKTYYRRNTNKPLITQKMGSLHRSVIQNEENITQQEVHKAIEILKNKTNLET